MRARRVANARRATKLALAGAALFCAPGLHGSIAHAAPFSYQPPGQLVPGSGTGRVDNKVYVPGMRFPIELAPAYLNSQVWGVGGSQGPSGSQCSSKNFSYPWWDNYCEKRSWKMPLCPSGTGHQGQDIRASSCDKGKHWVVATVDGKITNIGSYSVYLTANDGTVHRFLHMSHVQVKTGQSITKGTRVGKVSNAFGGTPTTVHLHFDLKQYVSGTGSVYVPTYMSLVKGYEALIGPVAPTLDAKLTGQRSDAVPDADGLADYRVCTGQAVRMWFQLENTGTASWTDVGGASVGQSVRLGAPGDVPDPLTGQTRYSVNANSNSKVVPASANPAGPNCYDKSGCRRTEFVQGGILGIAPASPGIVQTKWQLLDEGRDWFGPTLSMTFNVVECPGSPDASTWSDGSVIGVGGVGGMGGVWGAGGALAGSGSSGSSGQRTQLVGEGEEGCGCRIPGVGAPEPRRLAGLVMLAALLLQRRRRRP